MGKLRFQKERGETPALRGDVAIRIGGMAPAPRKLPREQAFYTHMVVGLGANGQGHRDGPDG